MFEATGLFLVGLVLLALGGDSTVKAASGLAQRAGLSPFATGMLLVAAATSLPELAVNLQAVAHAQPLLALGNAVGSNIVNVGLTFAAAAVVAPLSVRWHALAQLWVVLVIATAAMMLLGLDGRVSRLEGAGLLIAFAAVLATALRRVRGGPADVREEIEAFARTSTGLAQNLVRVALGAALMYFGAQFVVRAAPALGEAAGLSPVVMGLLPVAIGTALPELAAALAAARRGQGDMVAGHVIGSSVFNLLVVVGVVALVDPVPMPRSFVLFELPAALVFALMLYPVARGDMRVNRAEGGVLLALFVAWVAVELAFVSR